MFSRKETICRCPSTVMASAPVSEFPIQVPASFPEKYYDALVRSADQCLVKKTMENPPQFKVFTEVV